MLGGSHVETLGDGLGGSLGLLGVALGAIILGIALYYPCRGLNRLIETSKRKSEVML